MRISYSWLAEYVDLPAPEELARRLTAVGLEVEGIERRGAELQGVVAARVVASERHPNAEKLSVTRVDAGAGEHLQIVCGAKNYAVGDVVPLATVGTTLPGGARIERAKLRGIESSGMLCSAKELGIDADASGLLVLPGGTLPGTPIAEVLGLDDVLLEVNVTPNRPDCLSHVGIAREVAAALGAPLRMPTTKVAEDGGGAASDAVRVRIDSPDKCARYAARVIDGVTIGPSPAWLTRRLEAAGVRSISNVVDVTNFVLLELGHPLHAFDLDKVAGREIVVRTAGPGERLTTLDGKDRALDPDDLVIADRVRASALAGVMGGGDSEISAATTRVLVESAWFEPSGLRRTSKRHGLRTEASYRFERGADPGMVIPALDRCAALIAELAGGTVRTGVVDANPRPWRAAEVRLRWARPAELLGAPVPRDEVRGALAGLGFRERDAQADGAVWQVPSWRADVTVEEDLVEEIVRTRGFDAIPETLPHLANESPALPPDALALGRAREALEASGFAEAVNFSFVAPGDLAAFDPATRAVALANPITAELARMRTSLVPSLLRNLGRNLRSGVADVRLYEIAKTYMPRDDEGRDPPAVERLRIAGVLAGRRSPVGWSAGAEPVDFADVKGAVEGVLEALGLRLEAGRRAQVEFHPAGRSVPWLHPRSACHVVLHRNVRIDGGPVGAGGLATDLPEVGVLGELHPRVADAFELPRGVYGFELDADALVRVARLVPGYHPVPRFPAVLRDLAVVVEDRVAAADLLAAVREERIVEAVTLFDVYTGPPIAAGHKNLALAIRYRAADRTLTDQEADAAHGRIIERLRSDPAIRATLRS